MAAAEKPQQKKLPLPRKLVVPPDDLFSPDTAQETPALSVSSLAPAAPVGAPDDRPDADESSDNEWGDADWDAADDEDACVGSMVVASPIATGKPEWQPTITDFAEATSPRDADMPARSPQDTASSPVVEGTSPGKSSSRKNRFSVKIHQTKAASAAHPDTARTPEAMLSFQAEQKRRSVDASGELERQFVQLENAKEEAVRQAMLATFLPTLQEWVGAQTFRVLYNSAADGMTRAALNARICLHKNVMLLCYTLDGNLFGSFNHRRVPPADAGGFVMDDARHFVFTLRNPAGVAPTRFFRVSRAGPSLGINFDGFRSTADEPVVVTARRCFYIRATESTISASFSMEYTDTAGMEYFVFAGSALTRVVALLALEWVSN